MPQLSHLNTWDGICLEGADSIYLDGLSATLKWSGPLDARVR